MRTPPQNREATPPAMRDDTKRAGADADTTAAARTTPLHGNPLPKPGEQRGDDAADAGAPTRDAPDTGAAQYKALHAIRITGADGKSTVAQPGDIITAAAVGDRQTLAYFIRAGVLSPQR